MWETLARKHQLECTFFLKKNTGINVIHLLLASVDNRNTATYNPHANTVK